MSGITTVYEQIGENLIPSRILNYCFIVQVHFNGLQNNKIVLVI
jgi:hypothetical protein